MEEPLLRQPPWRESMYSVVLLCVLSLLSGCQYAVERPAGFVVLWMVAPRSNGGLALGARAVAVLCALCRVIPTANAPFYGAVMDASRRPLRTASAVLMLNGILRLSVIGGPVIYAMASGDDWLQVLSGWGRPPPWLGWAVLLVCSSGIANMLSLWRVAAVLALLEGRKEYYGRIRLWGGVGYALGSALAGVLVDQVQSNSVIFVLSPVFCLLSVMTAAALPADVTTAAKPPPPPSPLPLPPAADAVAVGDASANGLRDAVHTDAIGAPRTYDEEPARPAAGTGAYDRLRRIWNVFDAHFALFLALAGTLAFTFCVVETYVLVRVAELPGGSASLMGAMQVLMIVSEVPCFWFSNHCLKAGPFNVMCVCLALYAVRMALYAVLPRATLFLPVELLHGITYSLYNAASVVHVGGLAPAGAEATMQGVQQAIYGTGCTLGALVGGVVADAYGLRVMFMAFAAVMLPIAAVAWVAEVVLRHCSRSRVHVPLVDGVSTDSTDDPLEAEQPEYGPCG